MWGFGVLYSDRGNCSAEIGLAADKLESKFWLLRGAQIRSVTAEPITTGLFPSTTRGCYGTSRSRRVVNSSADAPAEGYDAAEGPSSITANH